LQHEGPVRLDNNFLLALNSLDQAVDRVAELVAEHGLLDEEFVARTLLLFVEELLQLRPPDVEVLRSVALHTSDET
jgi:hypothetical protein